ncbi:MAG: hypothetical protein ACLFUH_05810 [Bacteroidales bacterium]
MLYYITWLILIVYIINFIYNLGSAIVNEKRIVLKEEDPLEKYVSSILAFLSKNFSRKLHLNVVYSGGDELRWSKLFFVLQPNKSLI